MESLLSNLGVDTSLMCLISEFFGSKAWARIPTEKRKDLQPQSQECPFFGYSKDSKGYKLINLSTNKSFSERSVQFQEDPLPAFEVGESSSPP